MGTPWHPFEFPYIGLGLLDEASIQHSGDEWTAEYRIGDEPYLTIRVEPGYVEVVEVEVDGERVATTFERTLTGAIGLHGSGALRGPVSRFWQRAADLPGAFDAWVEVNIPRAQFAFVPAIGLGRLSIPWPTDVPWRTPEPGPIARRIGLEPFDEPDGVVPATMLRTYASPPGVVSEPIWLHSTTIPGILLGETIEAVYAANGALRSVAWRPFVENQPVGPVARSWPAPAWLDREAGAPTSVSIIDDTVADRYDIRTALA